MKLDPKSARFTAVGIELAATVVALLLLGNWLDQRWGTEPWLALTGVLLGFVLGFMALLKAAQRAAEDSDGSDG